MHRNVTAIYRTHSTADLVRRELSDLGVSSGDIHVIPDQDVAGETATRDNDQYMDAIHDLHLPEDDVRTYQQSVRRGDYVVSAEVDEDNLTRVQQIMRRPEVEAYNLETRGEEFRNEEIFADSRRGDQTANTGWAGKRDVSNDDPFARTYERNERLKARHLL